MLASVKQMKATIHSDQNMHYPSTNKPLYEYNS
jgi:hypothetical protein